MGHIRLLLSLLLICGIILLVKAEEQHHHLYQDDLETPSSRVKRDVLKGKDHDLTRSKRYIGRVPISYMKKIASPVHYDPYGTEDEDIISSGPQNSPSRPPSHFREIQVKQNVNTNSRPRNELTIEEPKMLSAMSNIHRNQRRYIPNMSRNVQTEEDEISPLSDQDIQSLLLLIDGYQLRGNGKQKNPKPAIKSTRPELYYTPQGYISPEDMERIAQMYEVGKRETGKRSTDELEQPMSFDNALYPGDRLEFLNDKRSKRIGARNLMAKTSKASNRIKKETDPAVLAALNRVFTQEKADDPVVKAPVAEGQATNLALQPSMGNIDHNHEKSKKSIDWSNYFGIDKRASKPDKPSTKPTGEAQVSSNQEKEANPPSQASPALNLKGTSQISSATDKALSVNKAKDKESAKKLQDREQNATENKEDQNWMLHEFYKNFAMSTNVKRKRESPSATKPKNDLEKLEELETKMTEAGDKIIWDALKYTGAHRGEPMSPSDLAQVKNSIIQKLSTAYSLEKVREAVEQFREQVQALEERNDKE